MAQIFVSTTFHGPGRTDLGDVLALLDGLDIDGVELGSTHVWRPDLAAVAATFGGRKLVHNYFPPARTDLIVNLASLNPGIRQESLNHALSCLTFAARIGAEIYTVHPGFLADATGAAAQGDGATAYDFSFGDQHAAHDDAFALSLDALGRLAEEARRLGVTLAVETEGSATHQGILLLERFAEYVALLAAIPNIGLTFNLAHTTLAALVHGYTVEDFIDRYSRHFVACELSHNDRHRDLHAPLTAESWVLDWLPRLPDVPLILEFRDASRDQVATSIALVRAKLKESA